MKKKLYLTDAQLKSELDRCLYCAEKPCMKACPANCSPADFIMAAKCGGSKDYARSAEMILKSNPMGQTCGLTCPDQFCMKACSRKNFDAPIKIPAVQATILEKARKLGVMEAPAPVTPNGKNVAVIGAGPAGMAAVAVLARKGYSVTLFEGAAQVGGAANLIPEGRLPHEVIEKDWGFIKTFGDITLNLNHRVANPVDLLKDGYDGVIFAVGEPHSAKMGIPGEDLTVSFMDYLREPEKYATAGNVAVLGGGAVATDCAITARQNGAENVEMFVRRRISDMRLTSEERSWLLENAIDITSMTRVEKIEKVGDTYTMYTCKTRFNGTKLEDIPETTIKRPGFTHIVMAVGSKADPKTEAEKVVYAGDCNHGGSTIVEAVASGKNAANELHAAITGEVQETVCPVSKVVTYKAKSCTVVEGVEKKPVDLTTDFFNVFKLRNPFLLSAAPHTDGYEQMNAAMEAGWAGGVMKTAFDVKSSADIHIPAGYMFTFSDSTYANCDNVSDHPIDHVCREIEKLRKKWPDRLIMGSTGGPVTGDDDHDRAGWQANTKKMENAGSIAVEYSLSCPQGGDGTDGDIVSQNAALTAKIIDYVMEVSDPNVPKMFKLTGAVTSIIPIIRAIQEVFAKYPDKKAGITLANSFPSLTWRKRTDGSEGRWDQGVNVGSLGRGVLPVSYLTLANAGRTGIEISGNGGPQSYLEAANFLALGVKNVQFCSIAFKYGIGIIRELESGLSNLLAERGLKSVRELIGIAQPHPVTDFMDLSAVKQIPECDYDLCVRCGNCTHCGYMAVSPGPQGPVFDPTKCVGCTFCTKICIAGALKMRDRTKDEIHPEIVV
jgi:dihydropyrimidine dehydrogenase (NAD+) subunit PreT